MDKIIKFFPYLSTAKDVKSLIIAILIYLIGGPAVVSIVASLLLVLLFPVGVAIGTVGNLYCLAGLVLSIMAFFGVDIANLFAEKEEAAAEEAATEEAVAEESAE